jgi:hypothetical protein
MRYQFIEEGDESGENLIQIAGELGLQTEKSGCRKKNGMTSKAASKRM